MKKVIIPFVCMVLLYSCANNKEKDKSATKAEAQSSVSSPSSETPNEDKIIKEWLIGKEWKAENDAAPFSILRVFSGDTCGFVDGKYHYTFKNGEFENLGATWPLTKINDSTFSIYVKPTQKTYSYKFVKNL